jgi:hypothetical protein
MALSLYICASLKLFSYVHVNKMCRKLGELDEKKKKNDKIMNGNPKEKIEGKKKKTTFFSLLFNE